MARVLVVNGTRDGHPSAVIGRVVSLLRAWGHVVELLEDPELVDAIDLHGVEGVVLASAPRWGGHSRVVGRFARENVALLRRVPAALLAIDVRLAWAGRWYRDAAQRRADAFLRDLGWHPDPVLLVAGAVEYTRYGRLRRALIKRLIARGDAAADTSRDHVYTDWAAVDRFAATVDMSLEGVPPLAVPPAARPLLASMQ